MPIFVYEPVISESDADELSGRECCFFETLQWSNEVPLSECPECRRPIRRAVTGFAIASQGQADPLRGITKKLNDGFDAGIADAKTPDKAGSGGIISGTGATTPAGRAAQLAYRHVCSKNCRH
jgi:predicted nucleic acid-binding Zn ribbon protein